MRHRLRGYPVAAFGLQPRLLERRKTLRPCTQPGWVGASVSGRAVAAPGVLVNAFSTLQPVSWVPSEPQALCSNTHICFTRVNLLTHIRCPHPTIPNGNVVERQCPLKQRVQSRRCKPVGPSLAAALAARSAGQALTVNWVCWLSETERVKLPCLL